MTIPILNDYGLRSVCKGFRSALLEQAVAYRPVRGRPICYSWRGGAG